MGSLRHRQRALHEMRELKRKESQDHIISEGMLPTILEDEALQMPLLTSGAKRHIERACLAVDSIE